MHMKKNNMNNYSPLDQLDVESRNISNLAITQKRRFSISASHKSPKEKPILKIDTKAPSTGDELLDMENESRRKSGFCQHTNKDIYLATAEDEKKPVLCDIAGSSTLEQGRTSLQKELYPIKHPAVTKEGDTINICKDCSTVICNDCIQDYSDEEGISPTPSQVVFPDSSAGYKTDYFQTDYEDPKEETTQEEMTQEETTRGEISQEETSQSVPSKDFEDSREESSKEKQSKQVSGSLIDDFADVSTEMPDIIDFDG